MGLIELFLLAVGLSMDAFAVAVCKGLCMEKANPGKMVKVGFYFGIFQAAMPLIGYVLGAQFKGYITSFDHWIAFGLLALIGGKMLKEAMEKETGERRSEDLGFKSMLTLSVATSIDALAVGLSFAFLNMKIIPAVTFIGVTTFLLSALGVKAGNMFGTRYKSKAEMAGGIILILIGFKILLEHLWGI
jgi:putative Mn2+ efflux pump MntP